MTEWWAAVVLGGIGIVAWLVATAWRGARAHTAAPAAQASLREGLDVFLAPWRADLDRTRRQVVRISLEPLDQDELLRSKVGGQAWWPEGEPAPTAADGTALVLLAQIDLGEMPAIAGFPDRGLLQFFISATSGFGADWDQEGDSLVAYWPDVSVRARRLPVAGDREYLPHRPSRPLAMHFELRDELVSSTDHRFRALCGGRVFEAAARFAATRGLDPDLFEEALVEPFSGTGHKVGGYPHFTQDDPRGDHDEEELLFQLDSDEYVSWGDAGVGNFFIRPADLARADFGRVLFTWDCH